jgi:hypothetical protein
MSRVTRIPDRAHCQDAAKGFPLNAKLTRAKNPFVHSKVYFYENG